MRAGRRVHGPPGRQGHRGAEIGAVEPELGLDRAAQVRRGDRDTGRDHGAGQRPAVHGERALRGGVGRRRRRGRRSGYRGRRRCGCRNGRGRGDRGDCARGVDREPCRRAASLAGLVVQADVQLVRAGRRGDRPGERRRGVGAQVGAVQQELRLDRRPDVRGRHRERGRGDGAVQRPAVDREARRGGPRGWRRGDEEGQRRRGRQPGEGARGGHVRPIGLEAASVTIRDETSLEGVMRTAAEPAGAGYRGWPRASRRADTRGGVRTGAVRRRCRAAPCPEGRRLERAAARRSSLSR